jgi:predicted dehydrogenase
MNTIRVGGVSTRRKFIGNSSKAAAGLALARAIESRSYAAEDNTIKVALVGCGGRGTGAAANALATSGPVKLWAVADVFDSHIQGSLSNLKSKFEKRMDVPKDRQFVGMDAFKKAIDSLDKGDLVLLATPPAFRPIHFEYAVQKGIHVFMEKSFAVDAPGIRRVLKTGKLAQEKNLKVAGGLMSRHSKPLADAIDRIHDGMIGNVITCWAYREHGPVGFSPRQPGMSELAHQISNYSNFTWLNGSFIVDWLIHNIDVCCWVKNQWPVSVQGQGGRQVRPEPDQLFDHYGAEYSFADGTRMFAQGRHVANCFEFFGDIIHGTTGSAVLGEGISNPRIYKGHKREAADILWQHDGRGFDAYQYEHDLLFDAIRNDKPYNETERCAKTCMTAIMGRMACESGKTVTYEEAIASNLELAPGLDNLKWEDKAPVMPDDKGQYPVAKPGTSVVL